MTIHCLQRIRHEGFGEGWHCVPNFMHPSAGNQRAVEVMEAVRVVGSRDMTVWSVKTDAGLYWRMTGTDKMWRPCERHIGTDAQIERAEAAWAQQQGTKRDGLDIEEVDIGKLPGMLPVKVTSVGAENVYFEKDAKRYFVKVGNAGKFSEGTLSEMPGDTMAAFGAGLITEEERIA